ncbi:unnamed protein product [Urochloa decumbens]|uniref:F-box domain-containing protein n=1 Tax=Urochloa decumbens TaxID=240449 RepID=A0ABC9GC53_9POAL
MAALPPELVEEILLRLPPDDPASLFRAALVCRLWRRLASGTGFRRRFCEFHHHTAPVLGVLCQGQNHDSNNEQDRLPKACFFSTSSFRPARVDHHGCCVIDARHGRVLLSRVTPKAGPWRIDLIVWDPTTDEQLELPSLPIHGTWKAAVVCAAGSSCDHIDCHRGSFLVVVVFIGIEPRRMFTLVYASDARAWSEVASVERQYLCDYFEIAPGVLLADAFYFLACHSNGIVKYDMVTRKISMINLMICNFSHQNNVLMTMEDGRLGLATMKAVRNRCQPIHLWSMEVGSDTDARFVLSGVIDLEKLLPIKVFEVFRVNGFADGARVLFISTTDGLYSIDIKSEQVKKIDLNSYLLGGNPVYRSNALEHIICY